MDNVEKVDKLSQKLYDVIRDFYAENPDLYIESLGVVHIQTGKGERKLLHITQTVSVQDYINN
jgi:hypothetical protein